MPKLGLCLALEERARLYSGRSRGMGGSPRDLDLLAEAGPPT